MAWWVYCCADNAGRVRTVDLECLAKEVEGPPALDTVLANGGRISVRETGALTTLAGLSDGGPISLGG